MIGWLLRLFGIGRPKEMAPSAGVQASARASLPKAPVAHSLSPEQFKVERRKVIAYVARARVPIRQAAAARQIWIADLSKVYEAIRTSPTQLILEKAGEVGFKHEPAFRDALSMAQGIEPPDSCEAAHGALIGWLTSLHAACLSLIDARRLKDRSLLGNFREHLSQGRRHAATLSSERARLFVDYQLKVRPSIKSTRARAAAEAGAEEDEHEDAPARPTSRRPAPTSKRQSARPPRVRAASGARPPPVRRRAG